MFSPRTNAYIIFLALLCICVSFILITVYSPSEKIERAHVLTDPKTSVHTVVLTEYGFEPEQLVIKVGDKVIFNSELQTPYWPASNLHPSHTIYPEFDSLDAIFPPSNWEFIFDRVGEWKYHDHLSADKRGLIVVLNGAVAMKSVSSNSECIDLDVQKRIVCWDKNIEHILETEGVPKAFAYFLTAYKSDPQVATVCHGWTHQFGEVDYESYRLGEEVDIPEQSDLCSYGYFHGFLLSLITQTQSVEGAVEFCDYVRREKSDKLANIESNCKHGIGHGITSILQEKPENYGKYQSVVDSGVIVCEQVYQNKSDREICYDGLFHELHLSILNSEYGFSQSEYMAKNDLFYYCYNQKSQYLSACFFDFVNLWPYFFDTKVAAAQYVSQMLVDAEFSAKRMLNTFGRSFIESDIKDGAYLESLAGCRALGTKHLEACIQGLAFGFVEHGALDAMHIEGLAFCGDTSLTEEESGICYERLISLLDQEYSSKQMEEVCDQAPEQYAYNFCNY